MATQPIRQVHPSEPRIREQLDRAVAVIESPESAGKLAAIRARAVAEALAWVLGESDEPPL